MMTPPPKFDLSNPDPVQLEAMLDHLAVTQEQLLARVKLHLRDEATQQAAIDLVSAAMHFSAVASFMAFAAYEIAALRLTKRE